VYGERRMTLFLYIAVTKKASGKNMYPGLVH